MPIVRRLHIVLPISLVWVLAAASATAQTEDTSSPGPPMSDRVAVLPFDNLGGAPDDDWIGVGVVETLATALGSLDNTTVLSPVRAGAILEQRGNEPIDDVAAASLGRELRARWVVAGSYLRQGRQLRITARLVDTVNDVLADMVTTSGTLDELFELQDRIALELTAGVRPDAGAPTAPSRNSRPPRSDSPSADTSAPVAVDQVGGSEGSNDAGRPRPLTGGDTMSFAPPTATATSPFSDDLGVEHGSARQGGQPGERKRHPGIVAIHESRSPSMTAFGQMLRGVSTKQPVSSVASTTCEH